MTALRDAGVEIPSNPKPIRIESGVLMLAPTGNPAASVRIQLFAFGPLPAGGPVTVPAVEAGLERRARAVRQRHVVEEHAEVLHRPVGRVGDRDLDRLAGVRVEVDRPLLPAAGVAGGGVPDAAGSGRRARAGGPVERLVVVEPRVQVTPARPRSCRPARCVVWPFASGSVVQSLPPARPRLYEQVVPGGLGVVRASRTSGRRHRPAPRSPGSAACRWRPRSASRRTGRRCAARTARPACRSGSTASC